MGFLGNMFGGGSSNQTVTQTSDPWSAAQPYLRDIMGQAQQLYRSGGPQFYPGQTFVGPTLGQLGAWDTALNYADQVFGGQPAPQFGQATQALGNTLNGNTALGQMANSIGSISMPALAQGFAGGAPAFNPGAFTPSVNFNPSSFAPDVSYNPSAFTPGVNFNPSAYTPSLGNISGIDTTGAFTKALSGTPDYSGLQGSIDAANAPIMRQFEQDLLPSLNQRATFLGNPTGGIKTLNRVLPELGERMALNAQTLTEGERQRALGAQQNAAQYLTGAGLQGTGLGQSGASTAASLGLQAAGLGQQGASSAAGLGLQGYGLGLQGAGQAAGLGLQGYGLGLQGAGQAANILGDYRNQLLGLGGLGGQLAQGAGAQQLQGIGLFPSLANAGQYPGQLAEQFANWGAGFQQQALDDQIRRWDYYQNLPQQNLNYYNSIVQGFGGLGGTSSQTQPYNRGAGALGGALAGSQIGAGIGQGYPGWGALIGGLLGGMG